MRRTLMLLAAAAAAATLGATPALGQEWQLAASGEASDEYIDLRSVARTGASTRLRFKLQRRLHAPADLGNGIVIDVAAVEVEANCADMSYAYVETSALLGGRTVIPTHRPTRPPRERATPDGIMWNSIAFACVLA